MTQNVAHDVTDGSGIVTGQPDLRDPGFVQNQPPAATPPARTGEFQFTQEQIEKARADEKAKQQKALEREREQRKQYEAELAELRAFREAKAAEEAQRQADVEREAAKQAKAARRESMKDLSAKEQLELEREERERELANLNKQWEQRFAQMQAQSKLEAQVLQLQTYIQRRVNEEQLAETIAPQFIDYITGTSAEEVEASIELAKAKTAEIIAQVASANQGATPPAAPRGVSVSGVPAGMPSDLGGMQQNEDDIDYTQLSMKDYLQKVRPKLGIGGAGKGLFD